MDQGSVSCPRMLRYADNSSLGSNHQLIDDLLYLPSHSHPNYPPQNPHMLFWYSNIFWMDVRPLSFEIVYLQVFAVVLGAHCSQITSRWHVTVKYNLNLIYLI